jgi:hypothetical protein
MEEPEDNSDRDPDVVPGKLTSSEDTGEGTDGKSTEEEEDRPAPQRRTDSDSDDAGVSRDLSTPKVPPLKRKRKAAIRTNTTFRGQPVKGTRVKCIYPGCEALFLKGSMARHFKSVHPTIDHAMYKRRQLAQKVMRPDTEAEGEDEDRPPPEKKRKPYRECVYMCPVLTDCHDGRAGKDEPYYGTRGAIKSHLLQKHSALYSAEQVKDLKCHGNLLERTDDPKESLWANVTNTVINPENLKFHTICTDYAEWRTSAVGGLYLDPVLLESHTEKVKYRLRAEKEKGQVYRLLQVSTCKFVTYDFST